MYEESESGLSFVIDLREIIQNRTRKQNTFKNVPNIVYGSHFRARPYVKLLIFLQKNFFRIPSLTLPA